MFSENKHEDILASMQRFIDSGVTNDFEIRSNYDFGNEQVDVKKYNNGRPL